MLHPIPSLRSFPGLSFSHFQCRLIGNGFLTLLSKQLSMSLHLTRLMNFLLLTRATVPLRVDLLCVETARNLRISDSCYYLIGPVFSWVNRTGISKHFVNFLSWSFYTEICEGSGPGAAWSFWVPSFWSCEEKKGRIFVMYSFRLSGMLCKLLFISGVYTVGLSALL